MFLDNFWEDFNDVFIDSFKNGLQSSCCPWAILYRLLKKSDFSLLKTLKPGQK